MAHIIWYMTEINTPILLIDTATQVCSVAIVAEGDILSQRVSYSANSHAANIGVFVQEVLADAKQRGIKPAAVALSSGPGSYTGLRIGSSMAKGLCFGMDIPLLSIPTLEILAEAALPLVQNDWLICPMLDARRMEVYTALFDSTGRPITETKSLIIDESSFAEELSHHHILFLGNGAEKCRPFLTHSSAHFADEVIHPLASNMVRPALSRMQAKEFQDVAYWEPFYLKEFIATVAKNKVVK